MGTMWFVPVRTGGGTGAAAPLPFRLGLIQPLTKPSLHDPPLIFHSRLQFRLPCPALWADLRQKEGAERSELLLVTGRLAEVGKASKLGLASGSISRGAGSTAPVLQPL